MKLKYWLSDYWAIILLLIMIAIMIYLVLK